MPRAAADDGAGDPGDGPGGDPGINDVVDVTPALISLAPTFELLLLLLLPFVSSSADLWTSVRSLASAKLHMTALFGSPAR